MSVKIRCRRTGANNDPCFRVVVTDTRSPRDGESIEIVGWYDPKIKGKNYALKLDRVDYWLGKGAIPSATVLSLARKARKEAATPASIPDSPQAVAAKSESADASPAKEPEKASASA